MSLDNFMRDNSLVKTFRLIPNSTLRKLWGLKWWHRVKRRHRTLPPSSDEACVRCGYDRFLLAPDDPALMRCLHCGARR